MKRPNKIFQLAHAVDGTRPRQAKRQPQIMYSYKHVILAQWPCWSAIFPDGLYPTTAPPLRPAHVATHPMSMSMTRGRTSPAGARGC